MSALRIRDRAIRDSYPHGIELSRGCDRMEYCIRPHEKGYPFVQRVWNYFRLEEHSIEVELSARGTWCGKRLGHG